MCIRDSLVEDVQAAENVLASAQSAKPVGKYDALLVDEALCRQQNIYAKTAASPNETTIVFAGDILFDDHYAVKVKMNQRGRGIEMCIRDRSNIIHVPVGKASFSEEALAENYKALMDAIMKAKPSALKGQYLKSITLATTMGPGVKVSTAKYC